MTQRARGMACKRTAIDDDTSLPGAQREPVKPRDNTRERRRIMTKGQAQRRSEKHVLGLPRVGL